MSFTLICCRIGKEEKFIGLRPTGPDTRMALGRYVKKNNGEREKKRQTAELPEGQST